MIWARLSILLAILACLGCATIRTTKANLDEAPAGIRVYPPTVCLLVDTGTKKTTLAYLPDYSRAYDVRPVTLFAKQDLRLDLDEGQVKGVTVDQDTTAFLSFLKEAGTLAAKGAGVAVSSTVLNGTFGLHSGIYCLSDQGRFVAR